MGLLALVLLLGLGASSAGAQSVQLTFYTLTAPHAALGAPVQWTVTATNTGATSVTMTLTVNLVAPDTTSYSLLSTTGTVKAGGSTTQTKTTTTSTLTSQTGAFQLVANITVSGVVVATQTIPLTITAVPSTGAYVSVGGAGPANALFGVPTTYRIVVANLGTSSMTLKTNTYLIMPDATQKTATLGSSSSYAAGANTIKESVINTAVWGAANGNFSVLVNLLDSNNNILSTDTYNLTRNPVPATAYVPGFTDTASTAGLSLMRMMMMNPAGCGVGNDYMPGGSGMGIADFDGDGYDDIYIVDMMGMGILYHNNGNGTFTDVTMAAGIPMVMNQSGVVWGDIDNDGRPDLLILTNNQEMMTPPVLLHNNGPNASGVVTFTDISTTSGIRAAIGSTQNLQSATFGDYDNDGLIDLYITVHVDCNFTNANDHLFHNNGNLTFTDRTDLLGGSTNAVLNRRGLVTTFLDYNGDGKEDIYTGNDEGNTFGANVLWKNGGGTFTDVSTATGAGVAISSMGIAVLDYNRDGLFDIFVTNVGSNVLLQGQSNSTFKQVQSDSAGAHVARRNIPTPTDPTKGLTNNVTWGTGAYDFNNDGWEDIFVSAGTLSGTGTYDNVFFLNNQDGTFLDVSPLTGIGGVFNFMPTAVFADFNNDGFMDAVVFGMTGTPHLYMNNARSNGNPYNWLQVKLVGGCASASGCAGLSLSNHDAIGARLVATVGTAKLWRQVIDGATNEGNSTLIQHFGLGTATQVDSLTVYWPSGKTTTKTNIAANQKITITEP